MVETSGFVIMMTQIKSILLSRIPLPFLARGRLGREGSHPQISPPCADILASWQGVCNNWLGTAASQLRKKQWNGLFCPLTAPSAVSGAGSIPTDSLNALTAEKTLGCRLSLYQLFRTRVKTGTELKIKKYHSSHACLSQMLPTRQHWGGNY